MRYIHHFLFALVFFTRIRVPWQLNFTGITLGMVVWTLPLIGLVVGSITALAYQIALWGNLSGYSAAFVALTTQFLLTGGLHEDGLADTADGMAFGRTPEQKIAIMRDSRIGSYGVLALLAVIGLQTSLWAQLPAITGWQTIIACAIGSRAILPLLMWCTPRACAEGTAAHAGDVSWRRCGVSMLVASILLALWLPLIHIALMLLCVCALAWQIRRVALRHFNGITGDVLGASQKLAEVLCLVVLCVVK